MQKHRFHPKLIKVKTTEEAFFRKTWNPVSTNPFSNFVLKTEKISLEVRKWVVKKLIETIFFIFKAITCTRRKQFWQPSQNLRLKVRCFVAGNWISFSKKKICSLTKDIFSKCFNVHFDCSLDIPAKKLLPKVRKELENLGKLQRKCWPYFFNFFLWIFAKLS